eukprot:759009-Hanusia_phi.AAC.1
MFSARGPAAGARTAEFPSTVPSPAYRVCHPWHCGNGAGDATVRSWRDSVRPRCRSSPGKFESE